ncbi:lipopolysaccharide-induced tumor necrosis factor-alpha factor homolog [Neocloeon triangulifer]|uniref:lipopolysaccharide-induced tumor necrosis factor-alpha factor homolog n=1 Tax=Neocloeon triangulifer TaxID=2078957 RepID=UPI00286EFD45|nr:lipopolysaccharide-induced tumor necrosis factor-alpha factor homolog [Neocloeon triangulifer]
MHPATVAGSKNHLHHEDSDHFYHGERPPPYYPEASQSHLAPDIYQKPPPQQPWTPVGQPHQQQPPPIGFKMPQPDVPVAAPMPPAQQVVVMQSRTTTQLTGGLAGLPHNATSVTCANCGTIVPTKVEHEATGKTHCWACCLFCFLCWPCVCLPYCMTSCRKTNHYCTRCNSYLGNSENL